MDAARTILQGRGDSEALANLVKLLRAAGYQSDDPPGKIIVRGKNHLSHRSIGAAHTIELAIDGDNVTGYCRGHESVLVALPPPGFLQKLKTLFGILRPAA